MYFFFFAQNKDAYLQHYALFIQLLILRMSFIEFKYFLISTKFWIAKYFCLVLGLRYFIFQISFTFSWEIHALRFDSVNLF